MTDVMDLSTVPPEIPKPQKVKKKGDNPWLFRLAAGWLIFVLVVTILFWLFGDAVPLLEDPNLKDAQKIKQGPTWKPVRHRDLWPRRT